MASYVNHNLLGGAQQNMSATFATIAAVLCSATTKRGKIFGLHLSHDGTPANNSVTWDLSRQTADDGTRGGTVAPNKVDPADGAALANCRQNFTVEPTITATSAVFEEAINQQATRHWTAYDEAAMLVFPATANNGFALRAKSAAYVQTVIGQIDFKE
jgi:hypothetical protein